jgi:hypothetical protein
MNQSNQVARKKNSAANRSLLLVLAAYTLLTLLMTWPTVTHLSGAIPGDGFDGWQNYWNQWWIKEALLVHRTHFFFTDILYPPSGASLLFHTLNFFNGLWTLPLQLNFGLAVAYNGVVFFHFILAGFGVYLLALYTLTRLGIGSPPQRRWAAFAAGVIFTFAPFHMAHLLGHMQVFSLTWPPFYILWLLRTVDRWQIANRQSTHGRAGLSVTDLFLTGLFLVFATMVDWYQTLYLLLFTLLLLAWVAWRLWRDRQPWLRALLKPALGLAVMGLAFAALFSPLIIPMAAEAAAADYMRPTFEENIILSADLLAFFLPSELHPLWGQALLPIYQTFTTTTSERLVFAGIIPLGLGIYGAVKYRHRRWVQFWIIVTLCFFVLALGPYLHIAGQTVQVGDSPLPLPYLLLYKIVPFIGISRSLSRYALIVMIGLGVLAAIGLGRFKPGRQALAIGLICLEFAAIPYPLSAIDTPQFFHSIAQEAGDYTIAALPMNWDRPVPLLYQTVHGKRLLTAYTSRQNPLDLTWRTPVLQQWRTLQEDIIKTDLAAVAPTILHDFQVKYVVLDYYQMPPGSEREATERWVAVALPERAVIYQDERLKVYQPPPAANPQPYLQLGPEWGSLEIREGVASRTLPQTATLNFLGQRAAPARLEIETLDGYSLAGLKATSGGADLSVDVSSDGGSASIVIPASDQTIHLTLPVPTPISRLELP